MVLKWFQGVVKMPSITLKNVPDDVYERLKRQADEEMRSINAQAIHLIDIATRPRKINADVFYQRVKDLRVEIGGSFEAEEIDQLKRAGRP